MHARTESPQLKRRLAFNRGRLAPPPAMDYRPAKPTTECVNQFQRFFLSELILHYRSLCTTNLKLNKELRQYWSDFKLYKFLRNTIPPEEIRAIENSILPDWQNTRAQQISTYNELTDVEDELRDNKCPFVRCSS